MAWWHASEIKPIIWYIEKIDILVCLKDWIKSIQLSRCNCDDSLGHSSITEKYDKQGDAFSLPITTVCNLLTEVND